MVKALEFFSECGAFVVRISAEVRGVRGEDRRVLVLRTFERARGELVSEVVVQANVVLAALAKVQQ